MFDMLGQIGDISPITGLGLFNSFLMSGLGLLKDWWSGKQLKESLQPGALPFDREAADVSEAASTLAGGTSNPDLVQSLLEESAQYGGAPRIAQEQENQRVVQSQQQGIDDILAGIDASRFADIVRRADELSQTTGITQAEVDMLTAQMRNETNAAVQNTITQAKGSAAARGLSADTLQALQSGLSTEALYSTTQQDIANRLAAAEFNREWSRNTLQDAAGLSRELLGLQVPLQTARIAMEQPLDILSITEPSVAREIERIMTQFGVDSQTAQLLLGVGGAGTELGFNQIWTDRQLDQERKLAREANLFGLGESLIGAAGDVWGGYASRKKD